MAIDLSSLRTAGDGQKPPIICTYGIGGVGKTRFAGGAPSPVFIQLEDGMRNQALKDIPTFGLLTTYTEVMEAMGSLIAEDHSFKTVVFDTIDWLEPIVWTETCKRNGWATIESADYGKGYTAALDVWREFLDGCNVIRNEKNMTVIFLAHSAIKTFNAPDTEPYDRYRIKMHESKSGIGAAPLFVEYVEFLFFMNYRTSIIKDDKPGAKKGTGHARGVGGGARVIYTEERPAFLAKNRDDMPDAIQLPDDPALAWAEVAKHIPYFNK